MSPTPLKVAYVTIVVIDLSRKIHSCKYAVTLSYILEAGAGLVTPRVHQRVSIVIHAYCGIRNVTLPHYLIMLKSHIPW